MKSLCASLCSLLIFMICPATAQLVEPVLEAGVSQSLANYRKAVVADIAYSLIFDIPDEKRQPIAAKESLKFSLTSNQYPLQIDFKAERSNLKALRANGAIIPIVYEKEHIIIDHRHLKLGDNIIEVDFEAGEAALNRNADFLYTLFVPDRARTVFPCFDQPDLKATYQLTLIVPQQWKAITNAELQDWSATADRKKYRFKNSDTLSTYLFAFAAGKFVDMTAEVGKMQTQFLHRENDSTKINHSVKEIFNLHSKSLGFFEEWTGIPYPFKKFGFVAIPDFQFGGMEHPGAISYRASSLFLDHGATADQLNSRSNLIAHETAHMWFGDLVTMNWFDDVWMKEVFANFMADKSSKIEGGNDRYHLKFLIDHFPAAYGVDRTPGANPIRQQLENLNEAGTMYGNIIYHKAPIMMQQLERVMGEEMFKKGVREYLQKFSNGNASWPDLIQILDKYVKEDLSAWNKVWVNEAGRPVVDYDLKLRNGKIEKMLVRQKAEYGTSKRWPQFVEIAFYYKDSLKKISVNLHGEQVEIPEAAGMAAPLFILFNSSGEGYGLWPIDPKMFTGFYKMQEPLHRATAYISLYENMLSGRAIKPEAFMDLLTKGLEKETEELNLKLMCSYISSVFWQFIQADQRRTLAPAIERSLWSASEKQSEPNMKKILFKAYQDVHLSAPAQSRLYSIWKEQKSPDGIKLTEDDYTALAFSLAIRNYPDDRMLDQQLTRISNEDRKSRFQFIMPSVSADRSVRDAFFKGLELKVNRAREANVLSALYYLHHPLRQSTSVSYLSKTLTMLEEIQVTGDIFFPQGWLQASFGNYQSKEAADIVSNFLQSHPGYNPRLKAKIEQTTDNLFRSILLQRR